MVSSLVKALKAQRGSLDTAILEKPELRDELDRVFLNARDRLNEIYPVYKPNEYKPLQGLK